MTTIDATAFAECEKEPLANSGHIQPNGVLLFIDKTSGAFRYASANAQDMLGQSAEELLGTSGREWVEQNLPDLVSLPANAGKRMHFPRGLDMGMGELDVLISATSAGWLLEFEFAQDMEEDPASVRLIEPSRQLDAAAMQAVRQSLVECVARASGFDRVMLYQFAEDWSGNVLAETVQVQQGEYLGLRFPASDIPAIARNLYAQTPYRHIPDSSASPVPLLGKAGSGNLLDLTWSDLRSVSPMHMQYLSNMNVLSSFSVSVMVEGKLWGLVACHHPEPRIIPLAARERCKELAAEFVQVLQAYRKSVQRAIYDRVVSMLEPVRTATEQGQSLSDALAGKFPELSALTGATSGVIFVGDQMRVLGGSPDPDAARKVHAWAMQTHGEPVFATDSLTAEMQESGPLGGLRGVLGISLRAQKMGNALVGIYLFRPEEAGEVAWAGNPNKPLESTPTGQKLSPRSSFEKWVQVRSGQSRPWGEDERFAADQLREHLTQWA